jgi:hypothetical protein
MLMLLAAEINDHASMSGFAAIDLVALAGI